jgi:hypothetical protein
MLRLYAGTSPNHGECDCLFAAHLRIFYDEKFPDLFTREWQKWRWTAKTHRLRR